MGKGTEVVERNPSFLYLPTRAAVHLIDHPLQHLRALEAGTCHETLVMICRIGVVAL